MTTTLIDEIKEVGKEVETLSEEKVISEPDMLIHIVLDRSGSMGGEVDAVLDGLNEFIEGQQESGQYVLLSLTQFDHEVQSTFNAVRIEDVPKLNRSHYSVRGSTALLDAVAASIRDVERQISQYEERPTIFFVVYTDGYENSSREFNATKVREMIQAKEDEGWNITYLGAVADAWGEGQNLGMSASRAYSMDKGVSKGTFAVLGAAAQGLRELGKGAYVADFDELEEKTGGKVRMRSVRLSNSVTNELDDQK